MKSAAIDAVIILLLFLFVWKTIGRGLIAWMTESKVARKPDVDPTNAQELKALRSTLVLKRNKLKNKGEIEQVQQQLNEVNAKLADLA